MAGYAIPAQIGSAAFFFVVGVSWDWPPLVASRLVFEWFTSVRSQYVAAWQRAFLQRSHGKPQRTVQGQRTGNVEQSPRHLLSPNQHVAARRRACYCAPRSPSSRLADVPSRSRRDGGFGQASTNEFLDVELLEDIPSAVAPDQQAVLQVAVL